MNEPMPEPDGGADEKPRRVMHPNSLANLKKPGEPVRALRSDEQPQLGAMRHVAAGRPPETYQQKDLLEWKRKDIKGFMAAKTALERAESEARGAREAPPIGGVEPPDEGAVRLRELLAQEWARVEAALKGVIQ